MSSSALIPISTPELSPGLSSSVSLYFQGTYFLLHGVGFCLHRALLCCLLGITGVWVPRGIGTRRGILQWGFYDGCRRWGYCFVFPFMPLPWRTGWLCWGQTGQWTVFVPLFDLFRDIGSCMILEHQQWPQSQWFWGSMGWGCSMGWGLHMFEHIDPKGHVSNFRSIGSSP